MKYEIQINKNIPTGIKIAFQPENKIISAFFHSIGLEGLIKTLDAVLINQGRGFNHVGFIFFEEMDEEDRSEIEIGKEDVLIYEQQLGEVIIKKKQFYHMLSDYSKKVVEYSSLINCPIEFKSKIENILMMIQGKIE